MRWDFALILFILLVVTGIIWFLDRFSLAPRRRQRGREAMGAIQDGAGGNALHTETLRKEAYAKAVRMPWWVEYGVSVFPVILFVFVLRSFIFEPFRIPSGSMLPTLQNGDFILVNKYEYGVRIPVINKKVIEVNDPSRGDVMVFRFPVEPDTDYIKRVVGLPGDTINYHNKTLYVNGVEVKQISNGEFFEPDRALYTGRYLEELGATEHHILLDKRGSQSYMPIVRFPHIDNCEYSNAGVRCTVPEDQYFVMGDNRDNSLDSRYWGFVPDENIVGRAFLIWMNFSEPSRIGRFQ